MVGEGEEIWHCMAFALVAHKSCERLSLSVAIAVQVHIDAHLVERFGLDKVHLFVHGATVVARMVGAIGEIGVGRRSVVVVIVVRVTRAKENVVTAHCGVGRNVPGGGCH